MDVSYSVLEIIQCSLSRQKEKHYLQLPIQLPCKHNACLECINKKILNPTIKEIQCFYPDCNLKHKIDDFTYDLAINEEISEIIKSNSVSLFEILQKGFKETFESFDAIDFDTNIDHQCDFIENDIDLRIESLKSQLDDLSTVYHEKLKYYKQIAKDSLKEDELATRKQEYLKLLQEEYNNTLGKLYEYEKKVRESKLEIETFILNAPKVTFNTSQLSIGEHFIGKFNDFNKLDYKRLIHDRSISVPHKFLNRIAYMEHKKQFLITDREDKTVKVLSHNGTYLGEFNPNSVLEYPFAIFVNNFSNEIFVGDYKKQCIFVFDDNFNYITEFGQEITKAPNTITMDKLTHLLYCTDYWYDRVSIWSNMETNSADGTIVHGSKYSLLKEFECDSPAYMQISQDKIFIVSAVELETDETNVKLKEIKKGANCILVFDKAKLECILEIRLDNWIEPYGLHVDSKMNVYTSASELDDQHNLSSNAFIFKFDVNGKLLSKTCVSNYIPIDFFIVDNRILSISTESNPVQLDEFQE